MKTTIETLTFPCEIKNKLKIKTNSEYKQDIKTIFNVKEIKKLKYVKRNNVWKKLTSEQKQFIIDKYIDETEIEVDKDYNVIIKNVIFNKNEIENIAYMFRNHCFDMVININNQDVILSNYQNEIDTQKYINTLRNFYNIKETTIYDSLFNINELSTDNIIQIIPQEKRTKFEKINLLF